MVEIRTTGIIERSAADVFAYIADYRRMHEWVFGITTVEPVGDSDYGPDAVFEGSVDLGPKTLSSTARISDWEQDRRIGLDSLSGFEFTATMQLEPVTPDRTALDFVLLYATSGGAAVKAFARTIEPLLALAARVTTSKLCDACLEAAQADETPPHSATP
ncbi:SRPBCC family protein [Antrihabitans stalactiti]|uniref:SRPBCC family protein n=1 Tax=Antrihabitans stalactiti TaxID=2584121 RepID=A0A848KMT2_9NOCA|nr:SRPBCC family protein [Antrihabitans stalactiti]NMN99186.1 SRPBCC family protein [Antrihabitans stalactiti]